MASLPPHLADQLKGCSEMKCGLPTLGWFKEEWGESKLRDALEHWLEYCRECEEQRPQRPATSGVCEEKEWVKDEEAENAQMSWELA